MTSASNAADVLIGSAYDTHFAGGYYALGGALAWQHTIDQGGLLLGFSNTGYPIGTLTDADADADYRISPLLTVSAGASLGEASTPGRSDTLYKTRVSIDSVLDPTWLIHAGYQYFDLFMIHGNLVTASLECRPEPSLGIRVGGGYDVSGTVADRYGTTEIDWYGRRRLFAGAVYGRTGYDPAQLGAVTYDQQLYEIYLGVAVPIAASTLTISIDALNLGGETRQTLRIGLNQPIGL